ncbi:STAS domain-containing protein [Actinoplanes sp. NPDC023801]|uniref:STAS domain-containing protein n=1 Tax=Actinoplanes sp. NPDC023801 TaxID=3154595 RepID=UPI0033F8E768
MTSDFPPAARLHIDPVGTTADGSVQVTLTGELDSEETELLRAAVVDAVRRHAPAPIRIDAAGLTFIDSGGIRALLIARRIAERAGSRFSMPRVHPNVLRVLEITGLLAVLCVGDHAGSPPEAARQAQQDAW